MIDWERAGELREEVGAEDFGEVFELFLEEVEGVLVRLREAPDPTTLEEDLHFLKGSALNLGFADFGALCFAGEKAAGCGQTQGIDIGEILDCYHDSKAAFLGRAGEFGLAA